MIYEPNKTLWKIGDLVIHDADAKEKRMLMRVIGYRKNESEVCETEYLDDELRKSWCVGKFHGRIFNHIRVLHDPAIFGIKP